MVQLFVYDPKTDIKFELDLYETDPIKITLTAESITEAGQIESAFSRSFRMPSTDKNDTFFKWWFNVNGIDFDVTKKIKAELFVDQTFFKDGQIRLQRVIVDKTIGKVDYETLFMGEVRDFASAVGQGYMSDLDLSQYEHLQSRQLIIDSWNADPSNPNAGIFNGDIVYPLIDFGVAYDNNNTPLQSMVRLNGPKNFTQGSHPLSVFQMRPMIRVKSVFDAIFNQTGYIYQSNFLNSVFFKKIYLSAFGNEAAPIKVVGAGNTMSAYTSLNTFVSNQGIPEIIEFDVEVNDFNNVYNPQNGKYTAPQNGFYNFSSSGTFNFTNNGPAGNFTCKLYIFKNNVQIAQTSVITFAQNSQYVYQNLSISLPTAVQLITGDQIDIRGSIQAAGTIKPDFTTYNGQFFCTEAPGGETVADLLSSKIKQIDFIKAILNRFRLVMVPDLIKPNQFTIEPWYLYIGQGDLFDWNSKLDYTKDIAIEPVFYSQSSTITFSDIEGKDVLNTENKDTFGETFGRFIYDSQNELIDGERANISPFASTPIKQIEGGDPSNNWIVAHLHKEETKDNVTRHIPIEVEPRLLFYNGLITSQVAWHLENNQQITVSPIVSYHENWPPLADDVNLNWEIESPYYGTGIVGYNGLLGSSVYEKYWKDYIDSLYDPNARKLTAYFMLDVTDLAAITFDDVIWVENAYWRIQKIYDAPIGDLASVKVDLIKLLNFSPIAPLEIITVSTDLVSCTGSASGNIEISAIGGTSPYTYTWTKDGVNQPALTGPSITNVAAGLYVVVVTDDAGRTQSQAWSIVNSPEMQLNLSAGCSGSNSNDITSLLSGGTAPFTYLWSNGATTPNLTGVPDAAYSLTVTDAAGCTAYQVINAVCTSYSAYRSGNFTRNNCEPGYIGSSVFYERTYTSYISQADANAIADANFNTDGQNYANINGTCTVTPPTTYSAYRSGTFTKNDCPSGYTGTSVFYDHTYTSTISQADADAIADANFNNDGQNYANANGICEPIPVGDCREVSIINESEFQVEVQYQNCDGTYDFILLDAGFDTTISCPGVIYGTLTAFGGQHRIIWGATC
jgi:hypothetical protein